MTFFPGLCGALGYQLEYGQLTAALLNNSMRTDSVGSGNLYIPRASRLGSLVEFSSFGPQHPGETGWALSHRIVRVGKTAVKGAFDLALNTVLPHRALISLLAQA